MYVVAAKSKSPTSVSFETTNNIISGTYLVRVRNDIGHSNALELKVKWDVGSPSWSAGGSTAGSVITLGPGSGYPEKIDFFSFNIVMSIGSVKYPVKVVSCCADNTISL